MCGIKVASLDKLDAFPSIDGGTIRRRLAPNDVLQVVAVDEATFTNILLGTSVDYVEGSHVF
jgi:hypothetical protein